MSELAADVPVNVNAPRRAPSKQAPLHGGISVPRFVASHLLGALFPLTAGAMLFSWRALAVVALVEIAVVLALLIWRGVGSRGIQARVDHGIWFGLLLAMTLPADLIGGSDPLTSVAYWPLPLAAGGLLVIFIWLLGGVGSGRVHPVLVTYLLLFVLFKELLIPQYVLQRGHLFVGSLFNSLPTAQAALITEPWLHDRQPGIYDSIRQRPAAEVLGAFTQGRDSGGLEWISLDALLRERMPPLEDLIVAGHPRPIGCASAIALIVGGLFMIYRGLIDYRVPLMIMLASTLAMILLPVPVVVGPSDATWIWLPIREHGVGWQIALTLVSYELMAGPLLFMAFFLATSSAVRPISVRARTIYAVLVGILTAVMQLYVSLAIGPYLALLAASLLTPTLDKIFHPRTLVQLERSQTMKRIAVLGSTGSIGCNALEVIEHLHGDLRAVALSAHRNIEKLIEQTRRAKPAAVAVADEAMAGEVHAAIEGSGAKVYSGCDGICEMVCRDDVDMVLAAIVGAAGLPPVLAAVRSGKSIALANKESLVVAGSLLIPEARKRNVSLLPVDSEHSAVFQAMRSGRLSEVRRVILTASGGPFRTASQQQIDEATLKDALSHPTWQMGDKITIDSATMFNKALEVIEACWLFDLPPEKVQVVVHPESVVHSMVEFVDGSTIAQLSPPDMRTPIQYALTYPDRQEGIGRRLDTARAFSLNFEPPDLQRFPSLRLGYEAATAGGTSGAVLNAANEVAVEAFRAGRIRLGMISRIVELTIRACPVQRAGSLDDLMEADRQARAEAARRIRSLSK